MSIQKPYNINLAGNVYPPEEDIILSWSISGGIQFYKEIIILDNSDDSTVFTLSKTSSFAQNYTVPANTLLGGKQYKAIVQVWDDSGNTSISDSIIFETSSRPIVVIDTVPTINAPSYTFTFVYTQNESAKMRSWIAYLYNSKQELLKNSGIQTTLTLSYIFDYLQSDNNYYIEIQATSEKGIVGTSGKIPFLVKYTQPNISFDFVAENTENAGVKLTWSTIQIFGESENAFYIDNEKIDVTSGSVWFDKNYVIEEDFSMRLLIENVPNEIFNIIENAPIIISATEPTNPNSLWLMDSDQLTEKALTLVSSPNTPITTDSLWIVDDNLTEEKILTINVDIKQPSGENVVWLDISSNLDDLTFNIIHEDDYTIYLRRYNNTFYLYKDSEIVDSFKLTATNYCLIIKRINNVWSIEGADVTP